MEYRPSAASFLGCLVYSLSPAGTAAAVLYFTGPNAGRWIWIPSALMGVFSALLVLQDIVVHLSRLHLDHVGIAVRGPLHAGSLAWSDVRQATLRERVNSVSRTDRLLVLEGSNGRMVNYPISVLSRPSEQKVLEALRSRTVLLTKQDQPSI